MKLDLKLKLDFKAHLKHAQAVHGVIEAHSHRACNIPNLDCVAVCDDIDAVPDRSTCI